MGSMNNSKVKRSNVAGIGGVFTVEVYDKYGNKKGIFYADNGWTNEGLEWLMERSFKSSKPSELTFYIGLIDSSGTLTGSDVMNSHSGWTENTNYSETARPAWGQGDPTQSAGTVTAENSTKRTFTVDTDSQEIYGAFLASNNTKGGTSGTLLCTGAFSSSVSLDDDDVLRIGYALNAERK